MTAPLRSLPSDLPLSAFIRDPFVREAFRRAEGDRGQEGFCSCEEHNPKPPRLAGGAAVAHETEMADG
jgi:hypothetical protein